MKQFPARSLNLQTANLIMAETPVNYAARTVEKPVLKYIFSKIDDHTS